MWKSAFIFLLLFFTASLATGPPHGSGARKKIRSVQGPPRTPELLGPKLGKTEHSVPHRGTAWASMLPGQKFRRLRMGAKMCLTKHLSHMDLLRQNPLFLVLFLAPGDATVSL